MNASCTTSTALCWNDSRPSPHKLHTCSLPTRRRGSPRLKAPQSWRIENCFHTVSSSARHSSSNTRSVKVRSFGIVRKLTGLTLSADYYDMMLAAYRTEISGLYRGVFKGFFQQLAQATAKGNNFDSRLSSMPPAAIGDHEQEKQRAMDLVRKAASDSRDKHTSSFALRYCLKQISKVILAEQAFIARMFFAGDGSNSGNATDRGLNGMFCASDEDLQH